MNASQAKDELEQRGYWVVSPEDNWRDEAFKLLEYVGLKVIKRDQDRWEILGTFIPAADQPALDAWVAAQGD